MNENGSAAAAEAGIPAAPASEDKVSSVLGPYLDNPYVKGILGDKLVYNQKFYYVMYQHLEEDKMTAVQAYEAMGFKVGILGENRASCAAKRAREKAKNGTLSCADEADDELGKEVPEPSRDSGEEVSPEVAQVLKSPYVKGYKNGRYQYHDEIYPAVRKLREKGMTSAEAFETLGIPVKIVGLDRANAVGKRAMSDEYATRCIFNPGRYDGSVPLKDNLKQILGGMPLIQVVGLLLARVIFLEALISEVKKKDFRIFDEALTLVAGEIKTDKFRMVNWALAEFGNLLGLNLADCLTIFSMSSSTYHSRAAYKGKPEGDDQDLLKKAGKAMAEIIGSYNGAVPGQRTIKKLLKELYGIQLSRTKVGKLMRTLGFVATCKRKDAYKGQVNYNHECSAKPNLLRRDFFKGPRLVILTDITYLYFGLTRSLFYLCTFRDAYTGETLGWACSRKMDQALVDAAYKNMMANHKELDPSNCKVYIHSDQGSVYLSTSFKKMIEDADFTQSVSRRANSLDNAPQESFFGTLKAHLLGQLSLAKDYETAVKMTEGAIRFFNEERISATLAWLAPKDFYLYTMTGIYPVKSYYGISAQELLPLDALLPVMRARAAKNAQKQRDFYWRKKEDSEKEEEEDMFEDVIKRDPKAVIRRDLSVAKKRLTKAEKAFSEAQEEKDAAQQLVAKIEAAKKWAEAASPEIIKKLKDRQKWKLFPELDYVNDMDEMF